MSQGFQAIDVSMLALVCGGEGEQNTTEVNGNIGVTVPGDNGNVQVGVQGGYKRAQSNYGVCVANYRRMGGNVAGLRAACGLPNGQP